MVYVFLAEGFEEIEAVAPIDILRRAGISVKTVGVGAKQITGSHGICLTADVTPQEVELDQAEAIVLPGGMPGTENLFASDFVKECVQGAVQRGLLVAAICAAPIILGRLGLLEGRKATCFPGYEGQLAGAITAGERVVTDGKILTAKGAGVAAEFAFALVALLKDEKIAADLKRAMQF